jgi:uncharacterized cupredoxin-like copper-binding protein
VIRILALALAAVALVGCGAAAAAEQRVELVMRHSRFAPAEIEARAGVPLRIVLRNVDPIDHEWIVGEADTHERHRTGTDPVHASLPTEVTVPAFSVRETVVVFDRPGTVRFICHLPGHEAYGMVGTLRVR